MQGSQILTHRNGVCYIPEQLSFPTTRTASIDEKEAQLCLVLKVINFHRRLLHTVVTQPLCIVRKTEKELDWVGRKVNPGIS